MPDFAFIRSLLTFLPIILLVVFLFIHKLKKNRILKKIRSMTYHEKCTLLNTLVEKLGYEYICSKDIFSTTINAWQREFGYMDLYDRRAANFNMIFDCEPVFFDYADRTWRIEVWKGQYGINTGGEIGVYYSNRILDKSEYRTELFQVVKDEDLLYMSLSLRFHDHSISLNKRHWWLTAFIMGVFTNPDNITMDAGIRFPNMEMLSSFYHALLDIGYLPEEIYVNYTTLAFSFRHSHTIHYRRLQRFYRSWVQWKNRLFCKLFLLITRPLLSSVDRLLFLYYQLPFVFYRTFRLKRIIKEKKIR